jgi:hypothetical protein
MFVDMFTSHSSDFISNNNNNNNNNITSLSTSQHHYHYQNEQHHYHCVNNVTTSSSHTHSFSIAPDLDEDDVYREYERPDHRPEDLEILLSCEDYVQRMEDIRKECKV